MCACLRYQMGNKGAFVKLDRECKPMYVPYEAVVRDCCWRPARLLPRPHRYVPTQEHPPIKPMAYAQAMNSAFGLGM